MLSLGKMLSMEVKCYIKYGTNCVNAVKYAYGTYTHSPRRGGVLLVMSAR